MTDRTPITMLDPEALTAGTYVLSVTGTGSAKKITVATAPSSTPAAASVTYAGSTNLAATNVEAALDELDAEKAAVGHNHVAEGAAAFSTVATSIPSATWTVVPLPSESADSDGYHDPVTTNHRLTVPAGLGGVYVITGAPAYATSFAAARSTALMHNGGTSLIENTSDAPTSYSVPVAFVIRLAAGDFIHLLTRQESGSAQLLQTSGNTRLAMYRIGL